MRLLRAAIVLAFALTALASAFAAQPPAVYKVTRRIELGGEGGWDYLTFDPSTRRLYLARATRVMVVDVDSGKLVGEIPRTTGVHGVALVEKLDRGVSSNGRDDSATIFDLKTLRPMATVKTGGKPDAILFDKPSGDVLTMNGRTNNVSVIDPEKAAVIATIALPGRPENAVSDGRGKIFVNLEDKNQIAEIDLRAQKVLATWPLNGCEEPTGLAIDPVHRRLFSGCHNAVLVVVDADSGENIQKLPIGLKVDAAAFDPKLQLIFTSNGDGTISIIRQESPNSYRNAQTVLTQPGARTIALDPVRHTLYTVAILSANASSGGEFGILVIERER
jgi:YVTN family beta-propeller protein